MPDFAWQARTPQGVAVRGKREATNAQALSKLLADTGLILTSYTEAQDRRRRRNTVHLARSERILVTQQFADSLGAGISVMETLDEFAREYPREAGQRMFTEIRDLVAGGSQLSEAMMPFEDSFSRGYVQAVRAGESSGKLPSVFEQLTADLEWQEEISSKVGSALLYPAILMVAVVGIAALFVLVVLPKFEPVFATVGSELPPITQLLLDISQFVRSSGLLLLPLIVAVALLGRMIVRSDWGRKSVDRLKLTLPGIRSIQNSLILARFTGSMATLLQSGVPLPEALQTAGAAADNGLFEYRVERARDRVMSGRGLAVSLAETGIPSRLDVRMIEVGERSGRLFEAFDSLSRLHGKHARRKIQRAVLMIEPFTVILIATLVLGLAMSILLPIYGSIDAIGN